MPGKAPSVTTAHGGSEAVAVASHEATALNLSAEIRVHLGDEGTALLRFSESRYAMSLDLILVPSSCRGKGLGTALIRRLLAIASSLGKPVYTTARPIGRSTPETLARLVRYYERCT